MGHSFIGTEHLLLALLGTKGVASEVLKENGVSYDKIKANTKLLSPPPFKAYDVISFPSIVVCVFSNPSGTIPSSFRESTPGSSRLRKLSIEGVDFVPDFEPGIKKYSALITTDKKELKIDYQPKDSQAEVVVKGNKKG